MCYPTPCPTCGLTTWAGCGEHVDAVRAQVPDGQWCECQDDVPTPAADAPAR